MVQSQLRCLIIIFQKFSWRKASIDTQEQESWIASQMAQCMQSSAFLLTFCLALLLCNNSRIVHALHVYLGKMESVKLSKSGIWDPATYLNQNCTGYTDKAHELQWLQLSLQSTFLLCLIMRDNSTHFEPRLFRTCALLHAGVVIYYFYKHQCLWITVKNRPTIACNMHTGIEHKT